MVEMRKVTLELDHFVSMFKANTAQTLQCNSESIFRIKRTFLKYFRRFLITHDEYVHAFVSSMTE